MSPVLKKPSRVIELLVAASLLWYPRKVLGPLIQSSPSLPRGTSTPSGDMNFTVRFGRGGPLEPRPTFHFFCAGLQQGEFEEGEGEIRTCI